MDEWIPSETAGNGHPCPSRSPCSELPRRRMSSVGGLSRVARRLVWGLLACLLIPSGAKAQGSQEPVPETAVVSAYLINFLHFVVFPEASFEPSDVPYTLCVLGPDDLSETLETMAEGQERKGRALEVRRLSVVTAVDGCHVLYVGPEFWDTVRDGFAEAVDAPLLTVGRSRDFFEAGGGINLVLIGKRLRFDVNRDAIEACGLKVDSRLLDAANEVRQSRRKRRRQG